MSKPNVISADCPVVHYTYHAPSAAALTFFTAMDGHQDSGRPAVRSDESPGYLIFTDRDAILDGFQQPDLWSSSALDPTEPDPPYAMIPIQLDPPEHAKWRHVLGSYFSPGRVRSMLEGQHRMAAELVEALRHDGQCDFVRDFARVFPSRVFLEIMGMPEDKLGEFMQWEDGVLHQDIESDPDHSHRNAAMGEIITYFMGLITERRANPDPEASDVVSEAIGWQIDGEPANDADILNCLLLLFVAVAIDRGFWTVAIAHTTMAMCFVTVIVQARLVDFDMNLEEAAMDLGASPLDTFRAVTLPLILPAIAAGWMLAFALSLDDLVIASFTTGPGATTLPIRIYSEVRLGVKPEMNAVCSIMIGVVGVAVIAASLLAKFNIASGSSARPQ